MNIYYVNDREGEIGFLHVVAPSRGSAKSHYLSYVTTGTLDFTTPVSVHILEHDVEMKEGIDEHFQWVQFRNGSKSYLEFDWVAIQSLLDEFLMSLGENSVILVNWITWTRLRRVFKEEYIPMTVHEWGVHKRVVFAKGVPIYFDPDMRLGRIFVLL